MSLKIIKAGILDTIQDLGRYGYGNAGINPGGVMDRFSAQLANCLLGKELYTAVIEMHFPASVIQFNAATIICIAGADFSPVINNRSVPLNQPVIVKDGAELQFQKAKYGARCYLSILTGFDLIPWLGSYSTNIKAEAGGYEGRPLKRDDIIHFKKTAGLDRFLGQGSSVILPWKAMPFEKTAISTIEIIEGHEWIWLSEQSRENLLNTAFTISKVADRMGYRLTGDALKVIEQKQLISSAVSFGTLQLLPNGQLIVLMADHQTTGGYPRVAHVISADLPALAQMKPNDQIRFRMTDIKTAEQKLLQQHKYLMSIKHASLFKIENLLTC